MTALNFSTPHEAVRAMIDAGAVFAVRRRDDALGLSFTYKVAVNGDREFCRAILAAVKARPPVFFAAFKTRVQDTVAAAVRGAA